MPAAQVGWTGEVPRGLTSIPVGTEDLDQALNTRRIEGGGFNPGKVLHLTYLKHNGWGDSRFELQRRT